MIGLPITSGVHGDEGQDRRDGTASEQRDSLKEPSLSILSSALSFKKIYDALESLFSRHGRTSEHTILTHLDRAVERPSGHLLSDCPRFKGDRISASF